MSGAKEPPTADSSASAVWASSERMWSAFRMSASRRMTASTVLRNSLALARCMACQRCTITARGVSASQSITGPSTLSASRARSRLASSGPKGGSPLSATSSAAEARQSVLRYARSPEATRRRMAPSSLSTCWRKASPAAPGGAISRRMSLTMPVSGRRCGPLPSLSTRTRG